MRGVVVGGGKAEMVTRERRGPMEGALKEGEVRLRPLMCGICGSDLHAFHGTRPDHP